MADDSDRHWHLDKRVPLALLLAILVQTGGAMWWASSLSERVAALERYQTSAAPQADRLTRVEVRIEAIQEGVSRIERMIQRAPQ